MFTELETYWLLTVVCCQTYIGVAEDGTTSRQRPWAMLEQVLTRTCDAWHGIDSERKQLDKLQRECSSLKITPSVENTAFLPDSRIAAVH